MTTCELVLELLEFGEMTVTEMFESLGSFPRSTIGSAVERLHERNLIHVHCYERTRVEPAPVYALGAGTDARKPPARTPTQRSRKYREKHTAVVRARRAARDDSKFRHVIQLLAHVTG